jgi:fructose-1,6-bisphosphatase
MPTILLIGGWRLYFESKEGNPMHIHAEKEDMECKFWMDTDNFEVQTVLEYNLSQQSRREIRKIIYDHFEYIISEWNRFFKKD